MLGNNYNHKRQMSYFFGGVQSLTILFNIRAISYNLSKPLCSPLGSRAVDKKHKIPSKVLLLGNSNENPVESKGLVFFQTFCLSSHNTHTQKHTLLAVCTQLSRDKKKKYKSKFNKQTNKQKTIIWCIVGGRLNDQS